MKRLIFLLFLFHYAHVYAQSDSIEINIPFDTATQKYTYTKIVNVPGKTAADLYQFQKNWSIQKYSDNKFSVEDTNKELIKQANFTINVSINSVLVLPDRVYTIIFNIRTFFKDEKSKVEITDIKLSRNSQGTAQEETLEAHEQDARNSELIHDKRMDMLQATCSEIHKNMLKLLDEIEHNLKGELKSKSDW